MEGHPPLAPIPTLTLHDGVKSSNVDPVGIVSAWLARLESSLKDKAFEDLSGLFTDDCWWRDIVGLSWDWTTRHGREAIGDFFASSTGLPTGLHCVNTGGLQPSSLDMGGMFWVQGGFDFKHPHGEGKGFVRLAHVGKSEWKAWTVYTQLVQLDFQKDLDAAKSLITTPVTSGPEPSGEVQVLIVGAGQAGVALGARLKHMGIKSLIIEKSPRVGDSWRNRYRSVALHTPTFTDHYPFLKIPQNWPRYLDQDRIANFMEHYSQLMELDILLEGTVTNVKHDEQARKYHVEVQTPTGTRTFIPAHVVLATGIFSDTPIIPDIPDLKLYRGQLYHSIEHKSASQISNLSSKKIVIVGSGASGHDIAYDFVTHGAKNVTMIQRTPIISVSGASQENFILSLWNTPGISTEEADIMGNSLPIPVVRTMSVGMTQMMCAQDKEMIDGLKKAGLALHTGDDGVGLAEYQLVRGGNFYIDQGANAMIIDGRIKVRRSEGGIKGVTESGLILADGSEVEADVVVLATGFHPATQNVRKIMGDGFAEKIGDITELDAEQERKGCWRATAVPGFWYMTGSFLWSRQYSLALALQIAAVEKGFNKAHYERK